MPKIATHLAVEVVSGIEGAPPLTISFIEVRREAFICIAEMSIGVNYFKFFFAIDFAPAPRESSRSAFY
jgi:hypothetical protein